MGRIPYSMAQLLKHWAEEEGCTTGEIWQRYDLMWEELGGDTLATRAVNALWREGYRTPEKVAAVSVIDLADIRNFGIGCLARTEEYQERIKGDVPRETSTGPLTTYTVKWEQEIEAISPHQAALKAKKMLSGPPSDTHTFEVWDELGNGDAFDLEEGSTEVLCRIPPHRHDFTGDEDTCTRYLECPVTWGQRLSWEQAKKQNDVPRETKE